MAKNQSFPSQEEKNTLEQCLLFSFWGQNITKFVLTVLPIHDIIQLVIGYADQLGYEEFYQWAPPFTDDSAHKLFLCKKEGDPVKRSSLLLFYRCFGCVYIYNLDGTLSKVCENMCSEQTRVHQIDSTNFLFTPHRTGSENYSLSIDAYGTNRMIQKHFFDAWQILATASSYISYQSGSEVRFFWRSEVMNNEVSPYFVIQFADSRHSLLHMTVGDGKLFVSIFPPQGSGFMASFILEEIENSQKRMKLYKPNENKIHIVKGPFTSIPLFFTSWQHIENDEFLLGTQVNESGGLWLWNSKNSSLVCQWREPVSHFVIVSKVVVVLSRRKVVYLA